MVPIATNGSPSTPLALGSALHHAEAILTFVLNRRVSPAPYRLCSMKVFLQTSDLMIRARSEISGDEKSILEASYLVQNN